MQRNTLPWLVVIITIFILCLYMVLPNGGLFGRPIEARLGLDIQGGLRVLMAADQEGVTAEQMNEVRRVIDRRVNALGVAEAVVQVAGTSRVIVELPGVQDPQRAIDIIQQTALLEFVDFAAIGGCTAAMPPAGAYILTDRQLQLQRAREVNTTPTPGASATAEATAAATTEATASATTEATAAATTNPTVAPTATAEATTSPTETPGSFRMYQTTPTAEATAEPTEPAPTATAESTAESTAEATPEPTAAATESAATPEATPEATPAAAVAGSRENPLINPCTGQPFTTVMTGAALKTADAILGGQAQNQYVVNFSLDTSNPEAQNFSSHTGANIGQPLAIVLDGEVLSAPVIQSKLDDGGEITGSFTLDEARALALQLRSGALPVALRIESLEQVGASLGAESINSSVRAAVVGIAAIFIFLLFYYRVGGLAAALALIVFGMMNFALYKFIPVTLTLSALIGFAISIGSAIDGNILIFERIKEELRGGRPLNRAVNVGYNRAWVAIRDSNISTIMIAAILYFFGGQFGASAVRGFAVTVIIGLVLNLFTSIIVTRVFLTLIINLLGERAQKMNLFGH